ncbi:hypothetical protein J7L48_08930 [bacterium]|nr:hypothetical protein [bacterium]
MKKKKTLLNEELAYLCPHCGNVLIPKKVLKKKFKAKYVKCHYCKGVFEIKYSKFFTCISWIFGLMTGFSFLISKKISEYVYNHFNFRIFFIIILLYLLIAFIDTIILKNNMNFKHIDNYELKNIKKLNKRTYIYNPGLSKFTK